MAKRGPGWLTPEARPSPELRRAVALLGKRRQVNFGRQFRQIIGRFGAASRGSGRGAGAETGAGRSVGPRAGGLMVSPVPIRPRRVRGRLPAASHAWGQALRRQGSWNRRAGACLRPVKGRPRDGSGILAGGVWGFCERIGASPAGR